MYSFQVPFLDMSALPVEDELAALGRMLLMRRFDEKLAQLFAIGSIEETGPLEIGGEAVVAGVAAAIGGSDTVLTLSPSHGHQLLSSGGDVSRLLQQIAGQACERTTGGGVGVKGEANQYRVVTAAAGRWLDLAADIDASGGTLVVSTRRDAIGLPTEIEILLDETAGRGLPLVVVIDYAVADATQAVVPLVEQRPWPAVQLDGTDVGRVQYAVAAALRAARAERGPRVLEATTFRYRGHADRPSARGDRPREETDPIIRSRARIVRNMPALESSIKALERLTRETIVAAAEVLHIRCETGDNG